MHTFEAKNGTVFNYNSDLNGDVNINRGIPSMTFDEGGEIWVNGADLLQFVAEFVRERRVAALENMEWYEVLGLEAP